MKHPLHHFRVRPRLMAAIALGLLVTIAVASQTADVAIDTPALRHLVLVHSVLSFVFNTAILAFTVNIAASMF